MHRQGPFNPGPVWIVKRLLNKRHWHHRRNISASFKPSIQLCLSRSLLEIYTILPRILGDCATVNQRNDQHLPVFYYPLLNQLSYILLYLGNISSPHFIKRDMVWLGGTCKRTGKCLFWLESLWHVYEQKRRSTYKVSHGGSNNDNNKTGGNHKPCS